jgi:hypothetical protein
MKKEIIYVIIFLITVVLWPNKKIVAQTNNDEIINLKTEIQIQKSEIQQLRNQINSENSQIDNKLNLYASSSSVLFLFGAFCALWAQNTGRNPWSWFFLGLVFSFITVIILLIKSADDNKN